jgi:serine/threonine-protein kinase
MDKMILEGERNLIGNRFEIANPAADRLGHGGMSTVYRGHDTLTGKDVAVKVLRPGPLPASDDMFDRFTRESEALRLLEHPNIVEVVATIHEGAGIDGTEDAFYLVMEYASGGTLRDLLEERQDRIPLKRVVEIGIVLSDALASAHLIGIIHRDIKPGNVLLTVSGLPLLTDFDLALLRDRPDLAQPGVLVGTIGYLSPEGCHGRPIDHLSDVWSFGVLMWELLSGRQPFMRATIAGTLTAIVSEPSPDLRAACPEAPDRLVHLLARILEKERRLRPSSMRLVGAELEAILAAAISRPARSQNGTAYAHHSLGTD